MGERHMEEKERRGRLGLVAYKEGDHFRMAPDREGFREETRPVVERFYTWHGEFEKRNPFSNPVETFIHRFGFLGVAVWVDRPIAHFHYHRM
jgi:hypothetical protein